MQKNKAIILSTMPVGEMLLAEAAQNNITIHEVSFIKTLEIKDPEIERRIHELSYQKITAIFTSRNAVDAVSKLIPRNKVSWKIFCTGNTTKKMVKEIFGNESILDTGANAELLAEKIVDYSGVKDVVFFCGDKRRDELPAILINNGIRVEEVIVYKTIEISQALPNQYDGILFFSPSGVRSFFSENSISAKAQFFAIGATTANAVYTISQRGAIISNEPTKENLVKLAIEHFTKK